MLCYLWWEKSNPNEAKFGERWVFGGQDPQKEIWKRIKNSLGVRKDLIKDGTIVLETFWDVTEYAKQVGRYYQRSRTDDHLRRHIGFRKGSTGEIHELPAATIKVKIDKVLAKVGQPLPFVGLTAWQCTAAERVLADIGSGHRNIIAELCARFGKTIWGGVLTKTTNAPLTIIASYVLTSFTSFEKDLTGYEQFKDFVIIDTADDEYQDVVDAALAKGKQVVAFLSMCNGSGRQKRINFLFSRPCNRLVLVDEADFGAHQSKQAKPLISAKGGNDVVVLMTGTNADKAANYWHVDSMLSVVYPELVMEKRVLSNHVSTLPGFAVDSSRHDLVVDVSFYQMNLARAVAFAKTVDPEAFIDDGVYLPSWSKFAAHPIKAKGFWTRMLQSVFLGQHGWDELNADYQFEDVPKQRVAMMFLSAAITNVNLGVSATLAQQALSGYMVVPIYGDEMTNRTAEAKAKEAIEKAAKLGQSVLFLAANMAQRSFSVGEITELYLAYDSGDNGATIQKISRALTPHNAGKVGRIVSLSFDPNRDDKFDALLIETALNYKKTHDLKSAKEALRDVIRTVDIFRCSEDGAIKLEGDEYLEQAIERKSVSRVAGKSSDLSKLTVEQLEAVAAGNAEAFRSATVNAAEKGRTKLKGAVKAKGNENLPSEELAGAKLLARAKEVITTVVENLDIIVYGTNMHNLFDAMKVVSADHVLRSNVEDEFGLDFGLVEDLFSQGIINLDLVELQVDH
jgi:hypothetical protein